MTDEFHRHVLDVPAAAAGLRLDQALARMLPQYSRSRLQGWIDTLGWEKLLNRSGTTFRKLPEAEREGLDGSSAAGVAKAVALMVANPSCIKRPVLEHPGGLLVGFKEAEWAAALG